MTEEEYEGLNRNIERNKALKKEAGSRQRTPQKETFDIHTEKPRLKYGNKPVNDVRFGHFDSTGEHSRWLALYASQEEGHIKHLQRQIPLEVLSGVFWEEGPEYLKTITWKVDFVYFDVFTGTWTAEDWKGEETAKLPDYKIKRQLFLLKYPSWRFIESGNHRGF